MLSLEDIMSDNGQTNAIAPTEAGASKITNRYVLWSMGAGLVPIPIIDFAAIVAVQLKMLSELAKYYGVDFSEERGKSIVSSLLGGMTTGTLANGSVGSLLKSIPGAGTLFGMVAMPLSAGATTYAVGKVFTQHFASGGTFLNFNPDEVRDYFEEKVKEGKEVVKSMKSNVKSS